MSRYRHYYHYHNSKRYMDSKIEDRYAFIGLGAGIVLGALCYGVIGAIVGGLVGLFGGALIGHIYVVFN